MSDATLQIFYTIETLAAHLIVAAWKGAGNNSLPFEVRSGLNPEDQVWQFAVLGSKGHVVGWLYVSKIPLPRCDTHSDLEKHVHWYDLDAQGLLDDLLLAHDVSSSFHPP